MNALFIAVALLGVDHDLSGAAKADPRLAVPMDPAAGVLLVELSSQSCAASRAMRPVLLKMQGNGCRVAVVDVDSATHYAFIRRFRHVWTSTGLPAWIMAIDGSAWETRRGIQTYNTLRQWYWEAHVARAKRDGVAPPMMPSLLIDDMIPMKRSPGLYQRPAAARMLRGARGW